MRRSTSALAVLALIGSFTGAAQAADFGAIPYAPPGPQPLVELGTGWYVRGDVGYAFRENPDISFGGVKLTSTSMRNDWTGGLGFGYKFNSYLRADVTGDYLFNSIVTGGATFPSTPALTCLSGRCALTVRGNATAATVLVNGYVDLGTYSGFVPYVGAGVGTSANRSVDFSGTYADAATGTIIQTAPVARRTNVDLAFALMAGVSVNVSEHTDIDIGYRYLNTGTMLGSGNAFSVGPLQSHQVRVGVRYTID